MGKSRNYLWGPEFTVIYYCIRQKNYSNQRLMYYTWYTGGRKIFCSTNSYYGTSKKGWFRSVTCCHNKKRPQICGDQWYVKWIDRVSLVIKTRTGNKGNKSSARGDIHKILYGCGKYPTIEVCRQPHKEWNNRHYAMILALINISSSDHGYGCTSGGSFVRHRNEL